MTKRDPDDTRCNPFWDADDNVKCRDLLAILHDQLKLEIGTVAERICCSKAHLSHVKSGAHRALPDLVEDLSKCLEEELDKVLVLRACKGPGVAFDTPDKRAIALEVRRAVVAASEGSDYKVDLPDGIFGAITFFGPVAVILPGELSRATASVFVHELREYISILTEKFNLTGGGDNEHHGSTIA